MIGKKIDIFGRVQGVGYRFSSQSKADSLGLKGSVKNKMDGSVEIFCYGDDSSVQEFIDYCKKNPGMSKVEKVNVKDVTDEQKIERLKNMDKFEIVG